VAGAAAAVAIRRLSPPVSAGLSAAAAERSDAIAAAGGEGVASVRVGGGGGGSQQPPAARGVCVCQELVGTCQVVAVYRCARGTDGRLAPFGFARFGSSGVLIVSINVYLQSNKIRLNFFDKFKRIGNLESGTNKIPLLKHGIPIPNSRPCFILINRYGLGIWNRKPTKQSALVQINSSPSVDKLDAYSASRPSLCSGIP
jgi:hypothetical protein